MPYRMVRNINLAEIIEKKEMSSVRMQHIQVQRWLKIPQKRLIASCSHHHLHTNEILQLNMIPPRTMTRSDDSNVRTLPATYLRSRTILWDHDEEKLHFITV